MSVLYSDQECKSDIDFSNNNICVVNLERRPDRLTGFNKYCKFNSFEIIKAFDGKLLVKPDTDQNKKELYWFHNKFNKNLKGGEKGCFISHINIYEKMINNNIPYTIIFEDDVIFDVKDHDKWLYELLNLIKKSNIDNYYIYLGGHQRNNHNKTDYTKVCLTRNLNNRGTFAYIISLITATKLYNAFIKSDKIYRPIDEWTAQIQRPHIQMYNCTPSICYANPNNTIDSDIRGRGAPR